MFTKGKARVRVVVLKALSILRNPEENRKSYGGGFRLPGSPLDLSKVERSVYWETGLLGSGWTTILTVANYFILDKYHLEKYIQTATAHAPERG